MLSLQLLWLFWSEHRLLVAFLVIWTLIWKGLALWKAARHQSTIWFTVLLVLNTAGLLEIVYYFLVKPRHHQA